MHDLDFACKFGFLLMGEDYGPFFLKTVQEIFFELFIIIECSPRKFSYFYNIGYCLSISPSGCHGM